MDDLILILLVIFSTHRLTRLLTRDEFPPSKWVRKKVADRWGSDSWQSYLSECDWCASIWIGGLLAPVVDLLIGLPAPVLVWWTASTLTGLIAQREPD